MKLDASSYQRGPEATSGLLDAFIQDRQAGFEGAFQEWLDWREEQEK